MMNNARNEELVDIVELLSGNFQEDSNDNIIKSRVF